MQIKGIVFDKDGTLFDFNATWASWTKDLLQAMLKGNQQSVRELAQAIGFDLETERFAKNSPLIAGTPDEIIDAFLPYRSDLTRNELADEINAMASVAPQVAAAPLAEILDELIEMGFVLGVATNDAEMPARAHLQEAGVLDRFVFVAGYDSGYGSKPDAGQLRAFCAQTGLDPVDCLMVGDSLHDLLAGQEAGMMRVGVLTGIAGADDLKDHSDVLLESIAELPSWLRSLT